MLAVALFFLADNGRINAFATYLVAIFFLIGMIFRSFRQDLLETAKAVAAAATILLLYLSITAGWSDNGNLALVLNHLGYAALIGIFIMGLSVWQQRFHTAIHWLAIVFCVSAAISAAISVYLFLSEPSFRPHPEPRLYGFGRLSNPVIAAVSYGTTIVIAAWLLKVARYNWQKAILLAAIALWFTAIVTTGTRVVWLALGFALPLLVLQTAQKKQILAAIMLFILVGVTAVLLLGIEDVLRRGLSFRPDIWAEFINRAMSANLLFGVGSGSDSKWVTDVLTFKHPHSIFVSVLYFGGIVGLLLLIGLLAVCAHHLWKAPPSNIRSLASALLVYGVVVGFFDGDNPLTKIDYLWWVIWLPVALCMTVKPEH